jgi:hypothetical protein
MGLLLLLLLLKHPACSSRIGWPGRLLQQGQHLLGPAMPWAQGWRLQQAGLR